MNILGLSVETYGDSDNDDILEALHTLQMTSNSCTIPQTPQPSVPSKPSLTPSSTIPQTPQPSEPSKPSLTSFSEESPSYGLQVGIILDLFVIML